MALVSTKKDQEVEYIIKPEAVTSGPDTSTWPLLLKNWSDCMCEGIQAIEVSLTLLSTYSNRSLYPNHQWLHSIEERSQVLHQLWCYQPRQTFQPFQSRSCSLG